MILYSINVLFTMESKPTNRLIDISLSLFQSALVTDLFKQYKIDLDKLSDLNLVIGDKPHDLSSAEASYIPTETKIVFNSKFLDNADDEVVSQVLYHELVHFVRDIAGLKYNGDKSNSFEDPEELAAIFEDLKLQERNGKNLLDYLKERYSSEKVEVLNSVLERYVSTKLPKKSTFSVLSAPLVVSLKLSNKFRLTNQDFLLKMFLVNSLEFVKRAKFTFDQVQSNIYVQDKKAIGQINNILEVYLKSVALVQPISQLSLFDMLVDRIYSLISSRPYINFKIGMLKEDIDEARKIKKEASLPERSINPSSDSTPAHLSPQDLPTTKQPEQFSRVQNPDQDLSTINQPVQYNTPSIRNRSLGNTSLIDVLESFDKEARIDPMLEAYPEVSTNPIGESGTKFDYPRGITSLRPKLKESDSLSEVLLSLKEDELSGNTR